MLENDPFVHEWHNTTVLHPLGILAMIVLGLAMLVVDRRWALIPILIMACFISPAQRVVIMSVDFNLLRVVILAGWIRIALRREYSEYRPKPLDIMVIAWALVGSVMMTILYGQFAAVINRLGFIYDVLGTYFLVRFLVRSWDDVGRFAAGAAVIGVPVAIAFLYEKTTGRNMFSVLGGVPEYTEIRQGKLRCQGAFAHPILAGCFWATLMPLMAALWWRGETKRVLAVLGVASAMVVVMTCASSTPVIVVIVGGLMSMLFPLRASIRWLGLAIVLVMAGLHFTMRAPVWHLLARVDMVGGSTGWYRYKLIDAFVHNFGDWWLTGSTEYAGWFAWGLEDVTSQYVAEGLSGGLLTLVLFVGVLGFAGVGIARSWHEPGMRQNDRVLAWTLFGALVMHCTAFLAVSYFGQSSYLWYLMLGMAGCAAPLPRPRVKAATATEGVWRDLGPAVLTGYGRQERSGRGGLWA